MNQMTPKNGGLPGRRGRYVGAHELPEEAPVPAAKPRRLKSIVCALAVIAVVAAAGFAGLHLYDRAHMDQMQTLRPNATAVPTPTPEGLQTAPVYGWSGLPTMEEGEFLAWQQAQQAEADRLMEQQQRERFASLLETNPEAVGWISVPGLEIDLPILQTTDNEYYLNHDLYKKPSGYGVPYVDYECDIKTSPHMIVYGHTMSRTSTLQFSRLQKYQDLEFCKQNPTFQLDTLYSSDTYKVVAAYIIPADPYRPSFFPFNEKQYMDLEDETVWQDYLDDIKERSFYTVDDYLEVGEDFVSLCTCSKYSGNDRIVIVARPLRTGEAPEAMRIDVNPDPYTPNKTRK